MPQPEWAAMADVCKWITDATLPLGKFLVPGCWNRVVHGDDADCQCADVPETLQEQVNRLELEIERLKGTATKGEPT